MNGGCRFCARIDCGNVAIDAGLAVAMADAYPLTPGHHLVLPRRHEADFFALRDDEVTAVLRLTFALRDHLNQHLHPDGFNVGVNAGAAAGQTVPHVHVHLIPRYRGDVPDPRGGVRWILPERAPYWEIDGAHNAADGIGG